MLGGKRARARFWPRGVQSIRQGFSRRDRPRFRVLHAPWPRQQAPGLVARSDQKPRGLAAARGMGKPTGRAVDPQAALVGRVGNPESTLISAGFSRAGWCPASPCTSPASTVRSARPARVLGRGPSESLWSSAEFEPGRSRLGSLVIIHRCGSPRHRRRRKPLDASAGCPPRRRFTAVKTRSGPCWSTICSRSQSRRISRPSMAWGDPSRLLADSHLHRRPPPPPHPHADQVPGTKGVPLRCATSRYGRDCREMRWQA